MADSGAAVLGLLKLGDPVIDRGVKLCERFLLLEDRVVTEFGSTGRPEVLADPRVEVAATSPERGVGASKVLGTFVEMSKFLFFVL